MNAPDEVALSFPANPQISFQVKAVEGIGLHITNLPQTKFSDMCTMLDIKFSNEPKLKEGIRDINNIIRLDALGAQIGHVAIDDFETKPCINWYSGRQINYKILITRNGTYKISALLAGFYPGKITFDFGNKLTLIGNNRTTSGHDNFEWQNMGNIYLKQGEYILSITADQIDLWLKVREFKMERQ